MAAEDAAVLLVDRQEADPPTLNETQHRSLTDLEVARYFLECVRRRDVDGALRALRDVAARAACRRALGY